MLKFLCVQVLSLSLYYSMNCVSSSGIGCPRPRLHPDRGAEPTAREGERQVASRRRARNVNARWTSNEYVGSMKKVSSVYAMS